MNGLPRLIGYSVHTDRTIIYTGESFDEWAAVKANSTTAACFALLDLDEEVLAVTIVATGETSSLPMARHNAVAMYYRDLEDEKQHDLALMREVYGV